MRHFTYWAGVVMAGAMIAILVSFAMAAVFGGYPTRPILALYADEWNCTQPSTRLDEQGHLKCSQFTAKGFKP